MQNIFVESYLDFLFILEPLISGTAEFLCILQGRRL